MKLRSLRGPLIEQFLMPSRRDNFRLLPGWRSTLDFNRRRTFLANESAERIDYDLDALVRHNTTRDVAVAPNRHQHVPNAASPGLAAPKVSNSRVLFIFGVIFSYLSL